MVLNILAHVPRVVPQDGFEIVSELLLGVNADVSFCQLDLICVREGLREATEAARRVINTMDLINITTITLSILKNLQFISLQFTS